MHTWNSAEWLIMAFDSTQQALRAEMLMEYMDLEIDTCPTPKEITAGCALSIQFLGFDLGQVKSLIVDQQVEIRGIFYKDKDEYIEIEMDRATDEKGGD
ncbi:DUF3343 domain-containing protein [Paenibacillus sp. 481]|uniref:DUF3343 domain-containing protein n=1 Tax=Paenibacillus sp. 481 TaxID=2835869 RepID=UPI001E59AE72|nr:DUF3343 domain-containing protein [Paenibacillus sp. 481]UHA75377.1 DUF3343 domain-containing protein [Paenibacillus sp. 481]